MLSTVEAHNTGQVGRLEIVPYCRIFPYFASFLFTNGTVYLIQYLFKALRIIRASNLRLSVGYCRPDGSGSITESGSAIVSAIVTNHQICGRTIQGASKVLVRLSEPVQSLTLMSQKFYFMLISRCLSKNFMITEYIF